MSTSVRRRAFAERARVIALPIAVCVLVIAASEVLNKRSPRGETLPPLRPLYQQLPGHFRLTPDEKRSCASALLISTENEPLYRLTSAADGVRFDLDADGTPERLAWTQANSSVALLAIDRDEDGAITSGKELFGRSTWPGASHAVAALTAMTAAMNGGTSGAVVSVDDRLFAQLLLWTDANHDGISEPSELRHFGEHFSDVSLGYKLEDGRDLLGNHFVFEGYAHVRTAPGRNRPAYREESWQRLRRTYAVCFAQ